jgi:hypothetical protein
MLGHGHICVKNDTRVWSPSDVTNCNGMESLARVVGVAAARRAHLSGFFRMAAANPLWGAPRIHGELCKLVLTVSERTVSRLLWQPRRRPSQTWRTLLTNHVATLVSMDFFTVPTLTGRVLFVLVLLAHARRRIIHVIQ